MSRSIPTVSIGVPVYNGGATLANVLESLLAQTFADFELIISDNASTDCTATICAEYSARDGRIRYIRQPVNLGPEGNFLFVLEQARGSYFMWSACDDTRSLDFLAENVNFLEVNPGHVASTSPNCFEGQDPGGAELVKFGIEGSTERRFMAFFENCWKSHGIFYAVIRADVLRSCDLIGQSFLGADWAIDLYLASRGEIHRVEKGLMISGNRGISNGANAWRTFRTHPICWVFPFYRVSLYALRLAEGFDMKSSLALVKHLLRLNLYAAQRQLISELYPIYCKHIKPWRLRLGGR
jgi:glycosyltransferase involved in cell wall biosynthesis